MAWPFRRASLWLIALALAACSARGSEAPKPAERDASDVDAEAPDEVDDHANGVDAEAPDQAADAEARVDLPDAEPGTSGSDAATPPGRRVLFVGNSFISVNDVAGHYREIVGDLIPGVEVEQVAPGGYHLVQHADDARVEGSALARFLRTGSAQETAFDAVVLQEQSQLGGFKAKTKQRLASIAAASELAMLATKIGAVVVLYATWGYQHGDPPNELVGYETYTSMQDALDEAYLGVVSMLREQGAPARMAPVGGGFRLVFEDVTRSGGDPLAEGSDFDALYEPDGMHPSVQGAYLASCIIAATITQADVRAFRDEPTLGRESSGRLRDVCARALADRRWYVPTIVRPAATLAGDDAGNANFGAAVTLSADASHLVISERRWSNPVSAWVFSREGPAWTLETKWEGLSVDSSIALNADATLALVGPPTRPLRRVGSTWTEQATLSQSPTTTAWASGRLALSADGTRALVAEPAGEALTLSARVFLQRAGAWEEEALLHGQSPGAGAMVALDQNGQRALLGPQVFVRRPEGWSLEATLAALGTPVALSADGRHAAVATQVESRVTVFAYDGAQWIEQAVLRGPAWSRFGASLALSQDGRRIVVGLPSDTPVVTGMLRGYTTGSARVYELHEGVFRHQYLLVPDVTPESYPPFDFGSAVASSAEGTIAVGAPAWGMLSTARVGRVYTFVLP